MASMIKRCDICGDPGVVEAIIICSECQVAREHLYCMREFRTQAPPWWRCEECQTTSPKTTDDEQKTAKVSTLVQQTTSPKTTDDEQRTEKVKPLLQRTIEGQNKNRFSSKSNFKEKWVGKGRTKYLSCDEAVKLSSGSIKINNSRTEFRSAHGMSKSLTPPRVFHQSTGLKEKATTSMCERTSIKSPQEVRSFKPNLQQHVVQQSISPKEKATLPTCERAHIKSPKEERNVELHLQQLVDRQSFSLKEKATLPTCERAHIKSPKERRNVKPNLQQSVVQQSRSPKEKDVLPFQNRSNAMQSINSPRVEGTNLEKDMKTTKNELRPTQKEEDITRHIEEVPNILKKHETISGTKTGCKNHADVEARRSGAGKPNVTSGLPVSEMHDPYIPALNSYWKGCFYLPNEFQKFNEAFMTHLPSRVHYKVYETVKKMPESIDFQLVSNHDIRVDIFPADRDDIGLYFFPMFKRRCENDISIIDFMWRTNLVMKSNVEGLELFVLSSRVLPSHAQEYQGSYFLWGVFRGPKTAVKVAHTPPLSVVKREPCYDDVLPGFKRICRH